MGTSKKEPITCCCGSTTASEAETPRDCCDFRRLPWVKGEITAPNGKNIPQVSTEWTCADLIGTWKSRWDIGRMDYRIPPGLYGVGDPDQNSPVLVSANYKMSFDRLRQELNGMNLWILVIDTKGINVWCAAGKGTFGTEEIVNRVVRVELAKVVSHRTLILPQLGAPGVAAHEVLKLSGFRVIYGPVRAKDLPEFLKNGMKATSAMRKVRFGFRDRLVVVPVELVGVVKPALIVLAVLFVLKLIQTGWIGFPKLAVMTIHDFIPFLGALLAGVIVVPALLPYIPGRAFAWKGWLVGLIWTGIYLGYPGMGVNWKTILYYLLILPPITSYLALNFTGATTYTSLSGVVKEMKIALPATIGSAGLGIILLIVKTLVHF